MMSTPPPPRPRSASLPSPLPPRLPYLPLLKMSKLRSYMKHQTDEIDRPIVSDPSSPRRSGIHHCFWQPWQMSHHQSNDSCARAICRLGSAPLCIILHHHHLHLVNKISNTNEKELLSLSCIGDLLYLVCIVALYLQKLHNRPSSSRHITTTYPHVL